MITSHPNAPEGLVQTLDTYTPSVFTTPSIILCRNTAPLVGMAYSLLQRDIPCTVLGRDIGTQLITVVRKMRATSLEDLRLKLDVWCERETSYAEGVGKSPERVQDQFSCLVFFIRSLDEDSQTVPDLIARIELLFSDDAGAQSRKVILSTIHKAKGLEYPTVFILDRNLCPSRYARLPWQKEQEKNLMFVAITRSMDKLFYISSDCWKDNETQIKENQT